MQTSMLPALPMHYDSDADEHVGLPEGASISFLDFAARYGAAVVTEDDPVRPGGTVVQILALDSDTEEGVTTPRRWIPKASQTVRVDEPRTTIELYGRGADDFAWAEGSVDVELGLDDALGSLFDEAAFDLGDRELDELVNDTTVELLR